MNSTIETALVEVMDRGQSLEARREALARIASACDRQVVPALSLVLMEIEPALVEDVKSALSALDATRVLVRAYDDPSPRVRQDVVRMLGYQMDEDAIPALLSALEDPDAKVREEAAGALIPLRAGRAVEALEAHLFGDANADVRMAAAQALGEIADDRAHEALERSVESETDAFARVIVELALGRAERLRSESAFSRRPRAGMR